ERPPEVSSPDPDVDSLTGGKSGHRVRFGRTIARTGLPHSASESGPTASARWSRSGPTLRAGPCVRPSGSSSRSLPRFRSAYGGRRACPPAAKIRPSTSSRRDGGLRASRSCGRRRKADYVWRLGKHLLPFFHAYRVSAITIAVVDEYRSEKVIERERITAAADAGRPMRDKRGQRRVALSNESINKTLVLLANV